MWLMGLEFFVYLFVLGIKLFLDLVCWWIKCFNKNSYEILVFFVKVFFFNYFEYIVERFLFLEDYL